MLDHIILYPAILVHNRPYWTIFEPIRPISTYSDIFGHTGTYVIILSHGLIQCVRLCPSVAEYDPVWANSAEFDQV